MSQLKFEDVKRHDKITFNNGKDIFYGNILGRSEPFPDDLIECSAWVKYGGLVLSVCLKREDFENGFVTAR